MGLSSYIIDKAKNKGLQLAGSSAPSSSYVPSSLQQWLDNPANKEHPLYNQALALSQSPYQGPGETSFDWLYSIFGQTPREQGLSQYRQYMDDSWRELLGKINEYDINTPAHLAFLEKQAGYNVDLTGGASPMNIDAENPVSPPDFNSIAGGVDRLRGAGSALISAISTAFSLYQGNLSLKNMKLQTENLGIQQQNLRSQGVGISLDNDEKELSIQDLAKGVAQNWALSTLRDGSFFQSGSITSTNPDNAKAFFEHGMSLDDFMKKGSTVRNLISGEILSKLDDDYFPFSSFSERNKKRFKDAVRNYVGSPEFAKDAFKLWQDRESLYQDNAKLASRPGANLDFSGAVELYRPFYELEMNALKGDYSKRIYEGDSSKILFNEKKFKYDIQGVTRKVLSDLKVKADSGDEFSKYLLFTMVTDPSYFEQINSMVDGVSDFITDFIPVKGIGKAFKNVMSPKKFSKKSSTVLTN